MNDLNINIKKCFAMIFSRAKFTQRYTYSINNEKLEQVCSIKDLGISIDSNMSFEKHTSQIVNDAYKKLGFIIRNAKCFNNIYCISVLYNSMVRSKLEYASVIWSPRYQSQQKRIEQIQKC